MKGSDFMKVCVCVCVCVCDKRHWGGGEQDKGRQLHRVDWRVITALRGIMEGGGHVDCSTGGWVLISRADAQGGRERGPGLDMRPGDHRRAITSLPPPPV